MSEKVELRMAFEWTCPTCGTEHFVRSMMPDLGPDDIAELRDEHGVQPWDAGEFQTQPIQVTCPGCKTSYSTTDSLVSD